MDDVKLERLRQLPVFARCSDEALRDVGAIADELRLESGHEIVRQHEPLRHAYFLLTGAADVVIDGEHVGTVDAGEVVGEVAMFDPAPAAATVTTTEPTDVVVLEHRRFERLVRSNPDLAIALLRTLARRFHRFRPGGTADVVIDED